MLVADHRLRDVERHHGPDRGTKSSLSAHTANDHAAHSHSAVVFLGGRALGSILIGWATRATYSRTNRRVVARRVTRWQLAPGQRAATVRTRRKIDPGEFLEPVLRRLRFDWLVADWPDGQQFAAAGEVLLFDAIGQEPIVSHTHKTVGKDVQQKPLQKRFARQRGDQASISRSAIAVSETDVVIGAADQTVIRDGRSMVYRLK